MQINDAAKQNLPVRKPLNHRGPLGIDITDAWYFITICSADHQPWTARSARWSDPTIAIPSVSDSAGADPVGADHRASRIPPSVGADPVGADHRAVRAFHDIANVILDEARYFHTSGKWFLSIMLVMPDHLHFIVHGPPGGRPLPSVIGDFKRYLNSNFGILFQKDFFDTRIRDDLHYEEKWNYICRNPVEKGFVATPREWMYSIAFDRLTGEERVHR